MRSRMMDVLRPDRALTSVLGAGVALLAGASVARGDLSGLMFIVALLTVALFGLMLILGSNALPIWLIATAPLVPFLHVAAGGTIATFDRLWIPAMFIVLAVRTHHRGQAHASQLALICFFWLALSFSVRAALTSGQELSGLAVSFDAILLPAMLFVVTRRTAINSYWVTRIAGAMMVAGTAIAAIGIAEHLLGFELASRAGGTPRFDIALNEERVSGPFPAPEVFALSICSCLAATIFWIKRRSHARFVGGAAVAIQIVGIALSFFRAAWIAAILIVISSFALTGQKWGRRLIVLGISGALIYAGGLGLRQTSRDFALRVSDRQNITGRLATYQQSFAIFRTAPVFGVGVGNYTTAAQSASPVAVAGTRAVEQPHSSYFGVLAEQGLVGFAPFLALTATSAYLIVCLSKRARTRADRLLMVAVAGAGLGYLAMSLSLTMIVYGASNSFFAVLLGCAAGRLDALSNGEGSAASDRSVELPAAARF